MIKRLFSKRSGFTLVEIIVAFAVFAIMSTMIIQLLNIVSVQRRWNNNFSRDIDTQDGILATTEKLEFAGTKDGTLNFDFDDGTSMKADFQMKGTAEGGGVDGLAYFVAEEAEKWEGDGGSGGVGEEIIGGGGDNTGAQTDRVNARIIGTKGFDYIAIKEIKSYESKLSSSEMKWVCSRCGRAYNSQWDGWDTCGNPPADNPWAQCNPYLQQKEVINESDETYHFYAFDLYAVAGSSMKSNDILTANYRLYFYDEKGKPVEILFANYVNSDSLNNIETAGYARKEITQATGAVADAPDGSNKYTVSIVSGFGIRVGTPFSGSGTKFTESNHTIVEIAFRTDPKLTVDSFGENGKNGVYKANATVGGVEVGPNIYGAFAK